MGSLDSHHQSCWIHYLSVEIEYYNQLVVLNKGKLQAADHSVDIQLQDATHQSQPRGQCVDYEYLCRSVLSQIHVLH